MIGARASCSVVGARAISKFGWRWRHIFVVWRIYAVVYATYTPLGFLGFKTSLVMGCSWFGSWLESITAWMILGVPCFEECGGR